MANDNETVEQVYEEMKEVTGIRRFIDSHYCNHCGDQIDGEGSALDVYADRILAAHKREMNALAEQKTAEAHEAFVKNAELAEEIAAKDAEIEKLRARVGELADALDNYPGHNCKHGSESCELCGKVHELDALVAKAREVLK